MTFVDYYVQVMSVVIFIFMLIAGIWRITCHFRKSCTWKNCPYRNNYHLSKDIGWVETGCSKFPPTKEEIEEREKMLDKLDELIEQLREENYPPNE